MFGKVWAGTLRRPCQKGIGDDDAAAGGAGDDLRAGFSRAKSDVRQDARNILFDKNPLQKERRVL